MENGQNSKSRSFHNDIRIDSRWQMVEISFLWWKHFYFAFDINVHTHFHHHFAWDVRVCVCHICRLRLFIRLFGKCADGFIIHHFPSKKFQFRLSTILPPPHTYNVIIEWHTMMRKKTKVFALLCDSYQCSAVINLVAWDESGWMWSHRKQKPFGYCTQ